MKTTTITWGKGFGLLLAVGAMMAGFSPRALAQAAESAPSTTVSAADFQKLQDTVAKLSDQVQKLEQANTAAQQKHEDDIDQIKQLQDKLDQTAQTAQDAEQKSTAVAQEQERPSKRPSTRPR